MSVWGDLLWRALRPTYDLGYRDGWKAAEAAPPSPDLVDVVADAIGCAAMGIDYTQGPHGLNLPEYRVVLDRRMAEAAIYAMRRQEEDA
jgi:hypothetical protein